MSTESGTDETEHRSRSRKTEWQSTDGDLRATAVGQEAGLRIGRRRLRLSRKGEAGGHHMSVESGNDETVRSRSCKTGGVEYRSRGRAPMLESSHVDRSRATTRQGAGHNRARQSGKVPMAPPIDCCRNKAAEDDD